MTGVITEGGATSQIAPGLWAGSMTSFNGGKGYWMITTESISFSFDLSAVGRSFNLNQKGLVYPQGYSINLVIDGGFSCGGFQDYIDE